MTDGDDPTVLIVEDDDQVRNLYRCYLQDSGDYSVRGAASGEEALEQLDASVDVVLLDRRMPGLNGDQTLKRIRNRGIECHVAMVTGVEPDFDIVDMGFDDYIVKPTGQDDLLKVVDSLLNRSEHEAVVQEYFALASKIGTLEAEKDHEELETSEEYATLVDRFAAIKQEAREALDDAIERGEFEDLLEKIDDSRSPSIKP